MTNRPDPQPRTPSLLRAILLGTIFSAVVMPALEWLTLTIFRDPPNPAGSVWLDYLLIKAASGVCVGAAIYSVGRSFRGPLRWYLYAVLFFLLIGGDLEDYVSRSTGSYLALWVGSGVISGVVLGAVLHAMERRERARAARAGV